MSLNYKIVFLVMIFLVISINFSFSEDNKVSPEVEKELIKSKEVPVIVKFRESSLGVASKSVGFKSAKEQLKTSGFKEKINLENFNAVAGNVTEQALNQIENDPNVESIELDHKFKIAFDSSIDIINASFVHSIVLKNNITGLGLGVCILDTGVNYSHVDFGGCFGNGCRVVDGYDLVNNDNDPYDDNGHGTHVTGIVNMIAPNASLIHVKVLDASGGGSESGISAGIDWCVGNRTKYNITAISMSIGSDSVFGNYCDSTFPTLTTAINKAIKNNITVFAASGNNGVNTGITSPGCIANVTSVGATNKDDTLASYSNTDNLLDLLAPGSDITSTSISGGYVSMSGTSMATPEASGSSALLQQFSYEQNKSYLSPYKVRDVLKNTGKLVNSWKRINVKDALGNIDIYYPEIYLDSPLNGTKYNPPNNISLNYTAKDLFLDKAWYNIDNLINVSLSGNISFYPSGGNHILTIFVNDTKGNTNFTKVNFGLNIPKVTLSSPDDNYNNLNGNLIFNCSSSDINGLVNISLLQNLTGNWLINQTKIVTGLQANASFALNLSGNLSFSWTCLSYNILGFFAAGDNRTARVNFNTPPIINYFYPNYTSVIITEPQNQTFNISYSDANGDLLSVNWYLNGNLVSVLNNYTFIGSYTSNGSYNISVFVNDSFSYTLTYWNLTVVNLEVCGDNIKNSTEACDGSDFGGDSCSNRGFNSGNLICNSVCSAIDASNCKNVASGGDTGGGAGSGGAKEITAPTEHLLPIEPPSLKASPEVQPELKTTSENVNVQEKPKEEVKKEPDKVEFIKKEGFFNAKLNNIIIDGIVGILILSSLIFFFRKEYLLIKRKNKQ